ncbi:MAG: hypothetical protein HY286_17635 [Planctomycetes bacterium]|nr:hypothetical protein [Planctomycetota bacterium]
MNRWLIIGGLLVVVVAIVLFILFSSNTIHPSTNGNSENPPSRSLASSPAADNKTPNAKVEARNPIAERIETNRESQGSLIFTITRPGGDIATDAEAFCLDPFKLPDAEDLSADPSPVPLPSARATSDGKLTIDPKFSDRVLVIHDKICAYTYFGSIAELKAKYNNTIVLDPSGSAGLIVVDSALKPIPGVKINARRLQVATRAYGGSRFCDASMRGRALAAVEEYQSETNQEGIGRFSSPMRGVYRITLQLPLRGTRVRDMEFVEVTNLTLMIDPISILRGSVKDKLSNQAVAGARVVIAAALNDYLEPSTQVELTNAEGAFEFRAAIRGAVGRVAVVSAKGYANEIVDLQELNSTSPLFKEVYLTKGVTIRGLVRDQDKKPLGGAIVRSLSLQPELVLAQTVSRSDGQYQMQVASRDDGYRVDASISGYSTGAAEVPATGGDARPLTLVRGGELKIIFKNIPEGAKPGLMSKVSIRPEGEKPGQYYSPTVCTIDIHKESEFILTDGPGRFEILAETPGLARSVVPHVALATNEQKTVEVPLEEATTVTGTILGGRNREPLVGANVALIGPAPGPNEHGDRTSTVAETGAGGKFTLNGIPFGHSELLVFAESLGYAAKYVDIKIPPATNPFEMQTVVLQRASTLRGKVISDTALPRGLLVNFDSHYGQKMAVDPDTDGSFWFSNLIPETYTFHLTLPELPGVELCITNVRIPEGEDINIEIPFGSAIIHGRIRGSEAEPAETFAASIVNPANANALCYTTVKKDGTFQLGGLVPGACGLLLESRAGGAVSHVFKTVELKAGVNDVEMSLSGLSLETIVKDTKGAAIPEVEMYVRLADSPMKATVPVGVSGANGSTIIKNLAAGDYKIGVYKDGFESAARWVARVAPGGNNKIEIVLPRESPLAVRVTDRAGHAIAGAEVATLRLDNPFAAESWEDAGDDGIVHFERLGAGEYKLSARADGYLPGSAKIALVAEKPAEATIALARAAMLKVTLASASNAAAGVAVTVECDGNQKFTKTTQSDGTIIFDALPAGKLLVTSGTAAATVTAEEGKTAEVQLSIP